MNVGPRANGTFSPEALERLEAIGQWMRIGGESIYGSRRCPFTTTVGLSTAKGNKVYIHAFGWSGEEICIAGVGNSIQLAYILPKGEEVCVVQNKDRVFLHKLSRLAPDPYNSVIVLELDSEPIGVPYHSNESRRLVMLSTSTNPYVMKKCSDLQP